MKRQSDLGDIDARGGRHAPDAADEDEALIQTPETFEDYDEFTGDSDATPDDRRRDPLRRTW